MSDPLTKYRDAISGATLPSDMTGWPPSLMMRQEGDWATYYAPFDHINTTAKVVLVGITPGLQQARNALAALREALKQGVPEESALMQAKMFASFSGPMRRFLISLLDSVGLHNALGIASCADFFGCRSDLVHYTSAMRYPVTLKGNNYSGRPPIERNAFPRRELLTWFPQEVALLPQALFIPLGDSVSGAIEFLAREGIIRRENLLSGLPHPSKQNVERINYFLGRKPRSRLSTKVNADKIDAARSAALCRVQSLTAFDS